MDPAIKTDQNRAEFIATIMEWRRVTEKTANLYWTDGWRVVERGIPSDAPRSTQTALQTAFEALEGWVEFSFV